MEPPILSRFSDQPVYDATTMVQMLRVRPLALWTWEQHLGISDGEATGDLGRHKRRYSERDLAALLWLRDRVIAGETPQDATARLLGAQRGMSGLAQGVSHVMTSGGLTLDPPERPGSAMQSGALNSGALYPPLPQQARRPSGFDLPPYRGPDDYAPPPTGALGSATYPGASGARPTGFGQTGQPEPWMNETWGPTPTTSGAAFGSPYATHGLQQGGASGQLGGVYSSALEPPAFNARNYTMSQSLASQRELRPYIPQLLTAYARFDTARAQVILNEALSKYGVENVCTGLVQPTVNRISELWSKSELSNPEERFGLNNLRGFMYSIFQTTQEPLGAPFAVVACAPNETSDFGAMLLAVLWRRAGLRVAYLGRGVDGDQLTQEPWPVTPAIIALTATSSQRLRALARIGKRLAEMPSPPPIFAYWGPIFVRNPELMRKLPGVYLGDDAATATHHARQLANLDGFAE
ncbi:MAG TPA: B12-binding domain-containing protein [Ktedonobacterales bacterium]